MNQKIIGIICAVNDEIKPFLGAIKVNKTETIAKRNFIMGELFGQNVVLVQCGVAKVNGAVATQILVDHFNVDLVIIAGTAGALDNKLEIGDTVVAVRVAHHDLLERNVCKYVTGGTDACFIADKGFIEKAKKISKGKNMPKIVFGGMASGEVFIQGQSRAEINKRLNVIAGDMEAAAVAQTCFLNDVSFAVVKSVTDSLKFDTEADFEKNVELASQNAFEVVKAVLEKH